MADSPPKSTCRRQFLPIAAGSFVAVGGAAALWPLFANMAPNRGSPKDTVEVDLTGIAEGDWRRISWRATPVVVRHRTPQEIELARRVRVSDLRDGLARVAGQPDKLPASDENRIKPGHAEWLVVIGACPRSYCLLELRRLGEVSEPDTAWFCPCDACRFDSSGRVTAGLSTENLAVPLYRFVSPTRLEIGSA